VNISARIGPTKNSTTVRLIVVTLSPRRRC
jgi:hypothetical protein